MSKSKPFQFLMLSAMYENGGNTTHRLLDGHPDLFVYPFESQLGTKYVQDGMSSMFPQKYRWPEFLTSMDALSMYKAIIDEEGKVRARTPYVSKFRDAKIEMNDDERAEWFVTFMQKGEASRARAVEGFFKATHATWKNYYAKKVKAFVGYSPIVGVDTDKIVADGYHVLHIVRNPFSAFADTKKRPVPMSLDAYMTAWVMCQFKARYYQRLYPKQVHVVRFEDVIENPRKVLARVLKGLGLGENSSLDTPSWNGQELKQVYPWGTIRIPTAEANLKTAQELTAKERKAIYVRTKEYLDLLEYAQISKRLNLS